MRIGLFTSVILLAATVLSGCTTVSETDFEMARFIVNSDANIKRDILKECIAGRRNESIGEQRTNAAFMNVSVAKYPQAFCSRLVNSVANGRLTYADVKKSSASGADNSKLVRIMQGR